MKRPGARPFRATVYLPGHGEDGRWIAVRKISAASKEGLAKALEPWLSQGYRRVAYEEVPLPLEGEEGNDDA